MSRVFHAVLESQENEHKRFVSLSRVPCHKCGGRGHNYEFEPLPKNPPDGYEPRPLPCDACDGRGDEPATKKTAQAHLENLEREYADFRLDDPKTLARYRDTMPADAFRQVEQSGTVFYPEDTHLVDGRFMRAGKAAGPNRVHRGWLALHHQAKPYRVVSVGQADGDGPSAVVTAGQFGIPAKNRSDGTANGAINWATDTTKVALTTSTYVPNIDTNTFFSDVTNEITGTGYTAGGATLASPTSSYDTASDQARFDAADTSWATSTLTARVAVVYKSTGTSTTSPLIFFVNFGADVSTTAGTFAITWDATGLWIVDVT